MTNDQAPMTNGSGGPALSGGPAPSLVIGDLGLGHSPSIGVQRGAVPWPTWSLAARNPHIDSALRALFASLDADVAARNPTCWLSGKCCKFDSYGHRLYVTGLEIAWLIGHLDDTGRNRLVESPLPNLDGCPFQSNGLCSVHALRPLGCRVYFCDPSAQGWQNDVYEAFLIRLKKLHEEHRVEYRYMEWRQGLAEARAALTGG